MSKKGAFVYQQIELTTAEWAVNEAVYLRLSGSSSGWPMASSI